MARSHAKANNSSVAMYRWKHRELFGRGKKLRVMVVLSISTCFLGASFFSALNHVIVGEKGNERLPADSFA